MKKAFVLFVVVALVGLFTPGSVAFAMTPTLSLYANGDTMQITVYGDAYAGATLYYQKSGYGQQSWYLGTTNGSGNLSTSLSASNINIISNSSVYVVVNGQQSSSVTWNQGSYQGSSISLSPSNVTLGIGQSVNVTISGGYAPYTMYSSNENAFRSVIGGNTLTVIGQATGSGTLNVCSSGSTSCATLSVSVNTYQTGSQITLSQNSVSLPYGGSTTVTVYGGGSYYVSSNSNSSIVSTSISGSTLSLYSSGGSGTSTITICQSNQGYYYNYNYGCATLTVTVGYGGGYYGGTVTPITLTQEKVTLTNGQSTSISLSGGSSGYYGGQYYVAYNSNSNGVQATVNGSTLNLTALNTTAAVIVVCSGSTSCAAVTVWVNTSSGYYGGNWTYCARENGYCYVPGTQTVRYGASGSYYYRTVTGGTTCNNATFGDPAFGVVKQCYYGGSLYY